MITQERLKEVLHYDPATGIWTWLVKLSPRGLVGSVAGSFNTQGYWRIQVDGRTYQANQLAWFYTYGVWVPNVDHRDRVRHHNWLSNLRPATTSQNGANRSLNKNSSSGVKGVNRSSNGLYWVARIGVGGKLKHLGIYKDFDLACQARLAAAREAFGEFACQ